MTAVSNRPQSFPLSLSHSSAVSFNLDKNKEHQPSTHPCPKVPPMSPPSVIGLSSRLASAWKGVISTLFQMYWSTKCGGPSQEKVCDVFLCFFLPYTPSAVNKRDSTALALAHLGRFPCLWTGRQIAEPKDSLSKRSHHVKTGIERIVSSQQGYWNKQVTRSALNWIISWIGFNRTWHLRWNEMWKNSPHSCCQSPTGEKVRKLAKTILTPYFHLEMWSPPLTSQYNSARWQTFLKFQAVVFERQIMCI